MYYTTLQEFSPQKLYETFIEAFSDYPIPVRMSRQAFEETNEQRSVSLRDSFGAFTDDGVLVGFILCGVRETAGALAFYDAATAVIASMRSQGVASELLRAALGRAKERGAGSFILEVIKENEPAHRLYTAQGFVDRRVLRCFDIGREEIPAVYSSDEGFLELDWLQYFACSQEVNLPYRPSWQNEAASIRELFPYLTIRGIRRDGRWAGYYVLYAERGDIMSIGALNDSPEIFRLLITDACHHTQDDRLRIINIEESSPLCSFLLSENWSVMIDQWEMVKTF